jgi:hypothetical protein
MDPGALLPAMLNYLPPVPDVALVDFVEPELLVVLPVSLQPNIVPIIAAMIKRARNFFTGTILSGCEHKTVNPLRARVRRRARHAAAPLPRRGVSQQS